MKIGIDASRAFLNSRTGTEEYSRKAIEHLAEIGNVDEFVLYVRGGTGTDLKLPRNFSVRKIGGSFLWTQFSLSREMIKRKIDVLFVPAHSIPIIHPRRTVVAVHGLEFKNFPDCYSVKERIVLEINTFLSVKFARKIIVPSENTKKDLMKFYNIDEAKIKVIHHGVEKCGCGDVNINAQKGEFNIIFIGRLEKRKNIVGIVQAFNKFMDKAKGLEAAGIDVKLTLAGKRGFRFEEMEKEIANSPYKKNIFFPGYVSEEQKRNLYKRAAVFIFPSFYEGFGMPVLEAMSYGVPVICSDSSSLKEITGDSALLIDPEDANAISLAIFDIFHNEELRNNLIGKGRRNAEKFSWEKCAKETLEVLKSC